MGVVKRWPNLPQPVAALVAKASKADIAEALCSRLALEHPSGCDDAYDDPEWLANALREAVNAERLRRGARPV